MYAYIENMFVHCLISDEDSTFPGIPIEERYSSEFLDKCIKIEEHHGEVNEGYLYDYDFDTFRLPSPEELEVFNLTDNPEYEDENYSNDIEEKLNNLVESIENLNEFIEGLTETIIQ